MARRRGSTGLSAILLVDKPACWTSHDVVARIKSATGEGRIGHAGTLDPMATGLLVIAIGPATRLLTHLQSQVKSYRATVQFGSATTTDDAEGDVVEVAPVDPAIFEPSSVDAVLAGLVGTHQQTPPAYSAIKVDGRRSYAAARAGEQLDLAPREITIESVSLVASDATARTLTFDITVSKGTYIRAIARDLGERLGTVAHLSALRRLTSGGLAVDGASSVDDIVRAAAEGVGSLSELFVDPTRALGFPYVRANDREVESGRAIRRRLEAFGSADAGAGAPQLLSVVTSDSRVLGIYRTDSADVLFAETVIARPVLPPRLGPSAVALGVFDGVHAGHTAIVRSAVAHAHTHGLRAVAVTHDPLPEVVLGVESPPTQVTSIEARVALLEHLGVDDVVVVPFTAELATQAAPRYVEDVLLGRIDARVAFVGADYRFGALAEGTPDTLREWMDVNVVEEVEVEGHRARSTDIRRALAEGDVAHAAMLTGRPVAVIGEVIRGQAVGATIGTPTANLSASAESQSVRHGIYAARVARIVNPARPERGDAADLDGRLGSWRAYLAGLDHGTLEYRDAAVFVGRPSPQGVEGAFAFEVHILDANEDLYGAVLAVELVQFMRDPVTFPDLEALKRGIASDLKGVREVLNRASDGPI